MVLWLSATTQPEVFNLSRTRVPSSRVETCRTAGQNGALGRSILTCPIAITWVRCGHLSIAVGSRMVPDLCHCTLHVFTLPAVLQNRDKQFWPLGLVHSGSSIDLKCPRSKKLQRFTCTQGRQLAITTLMNL